MKGVVPLVPSKNKLAVSALREIVGKKVYYDCNINEVVEEWIDV